jgi:hypothetical protein
MVSVQGIGEVGFIKAPAKKNTKTSIAPHQLYKTKGQSEGDPKLVMAAFPDSSTRFVNDKEIRFAPRQLLKAVAMWMDKHGKVMTEGTHFVEQDFLLELSADDPNISVQGLIANIEKRLAEFEMVVKNPTPKDTVRSMDIRATKLDRLIGNLRSLKADGASSKAYDFGKRLHQANIRRRYGNPQGRAESVEDGQITEAKIAFKKILKGIDDAQGPFTVVVMRADAPGAMMQEKVKIAAALPAYINHMVTFSLTGKKWKAIVIENSKGQVVNVLRPTDIKEEVEVSEAVDGPWENASIVGIKSQRVAGWKTELKTARGHGGAPHGHQVYFLYHDGKGNFTVYHGDSLGKVVPAASAKKPVGVFKSKEDAMAGAKKDAASLHREEVEVSEAWWNSSTLSKQDADSLLDDLESAYKKGGLRGTFKVPNGDSGPVWEMIDGLTDFLRGEPKNMIAYVLKGVKDFLSPTDRNDSRIKKVFESFTEDGEAISESVSATKEYRQQKIQSNRRLIVKLGTAAQGVKDTEARREMTQTLSSADTYNRRLGTPEMMKSGPAYWVNFEGIYVGRELERVRGLLIHHGIVVA